MRGSAGYALIEMLVSLVIIGLLSAMMIQGLGATHRVWGHVDAANISADQVAGAQLLLRQRIEGVIPTTEFDKIPSYAFFDGKADQLTFFGPPRDVQGSNSPQTYQLGLAANGDLILLYQGDTVPKSMKLAPKPLVLLHSVQGLDIAYFGIAPPDNRPAWRFTWEQRPAPPELIRIRVQFAPQDPRVWPELLIKPYTTVDTLCVLIVRTGTCRGRAPL